MSTQTKILAIIRRHQAGDRLALAELIAANQGLIRRLAARWQSSAAPAEDLMQEGALSLLDCADSFREEDGVAWGTFLGTACWRRMERYAKRESAHQPAPFDDFTVSQTDWLDQLMSDSGVVDEATARVDDRAALANEYHAALHLIDRLPLLERRAVYARFGLDDGSHAVRTVVEVAAAIGVGQKRAYTLLHVAYERLRGMLADAEAGVAA